MRRRQGTCGLLAFKVKGINIYNYAATNMKLKIVNTNKHENNFKSAKSSQNQL